MAKQNKLELVGRTLEEKVIDMDKYRSRHMKRVNEGVLQMEQQR